MSRLKRGDLPSYRYHKARNCAVVTIDGHDHYLGPFGTPASKQKYAKLIRAWQERQEQQQTEDAVSDSLAQERPLTLGDRPTINELILIYLKHAADYYRSYHGENKEAGCISDALEVLQKLYGRESADTFRPKDLKRVREAMIAKKWSRNYINSQVNRVKRMFAYGVEEDLIPGTVYHALLAVKGIRKGTPGVRETKKVKPVPTDDIKAVLKKARPMLGAMIRIAYFTGARPGEICALKPCHLNTRGRVWVYNVPPDANKTEHHDQERTVYIGPKAQKVLEPWLKDITPEEHVFSPARDDALRQQERRKARKTPLWPSHVKRLEAKRKVQPKRIKGDHYTPTSFRRVIKRLCKTLRLSSWTPNRLRHNAATRFRKRYGIETARILLGHSKVNTTEIYAEPNRRKATKAIEEIG